MTDPRRLAGLLLVSLGVAWAAAQAFDIQGPIVIPALGVALLAGHVATRAYGLLVPGGILTGLGVGVMVAAGGGPDEAVVLGLGIGFVFIALVDAVFGGRQGAWWWPLIPGGILAAVGVGRLAGVDDLGVYLVPAALMIVGLVLLAPSLRPRSPSSQSSDGQASSPSAGEVDW